MHRSVGFQGGDAGVFQKGSPGLQGKDIPVLLHNLGRYDPVIRQVSVGHVCGEDDMGRIGVGKPQGVHLRMGCEEGQESEKYGGY